MLSRLLARSLSKPSSAICGKAMAQRNMSSVLVDKDDDKICTVNLNRPPVNSLGLEFMREIVDAIDMVEKDGRGLVLTSTNKSIFCAGLDLQEMYQPDEQRLRDFWFTLQELWLRLFGLKVPAGAAINGHSPAGGALMASACDYRAMVASTKFTIGLNEAKFGLVAPFWFMDSFTALVGQRESEFALLNGKLYGVNEALDVGLIDTIVANQEEAVSRCKEVIGEMNSCVPKAWSLTKLAMREAPIQRLKAKRREDVDNFVQFVMEDSMQQHLSAYLSALSSKKQKK